MTTASLRDDAFGSDLAHSLKQLIPDAQDVIDVDDPLTAGTADDISQQYLAVFDCAVPEVVPVKVH